MDGLSESTDPHYWKNKARREGALADLLTLDLAYQRGELLDKATVESVAFNLARTMRDGLLGLPSRLASVIAAMTNTSEIEGLMHSAFEPIFTDHEKMSAQNIARLAERKG